LKIVKLKIENSLSWVLGVELLCELRSFFATSRETNLFCCGLPAMDAEINSA